MYVARVCLAMSVPIWLLLLATDERPKDEMIVFGAEQ